MVELAFNLEGTILFVLTFMDSLGLGSNTSGPRKSKYLIRGNRNQPCPGLLDRPYLALSFLSLVSSVVSYRDSSSNPDVFIEKRGVTNKDLLVLDPGIVLVALAATPSLGNAIGSTALCSKTS